MIGATLCCVGDCRNVAIEQSKQRFPGGMVCGEHADDTSFIAPRGEWTSDRVFEEDPIEGLKYDGGKRDWGLLIGREAMPDALEAVVRVLEFGARKYNPHNWRHVEGAERRYWNAMIRHIVADAREPADPETSESHLAHIVCCALFLLQKRLEDK